MQFHTGLDVFFFSDLYLLRQESQRQQIANTYIQVSQYRSMLPSTVQGSWVRFKVLKYKFWIKYGFDAFGHKPICTLGFLPKIPFKLTQSIHVALQKTAILTKKCQNIQFLTLKPIKETLGFILKIMKKIARWRHKSEISKRNVKTMISPLLFRL